MIKYVETLVSEGSSIVIEIEPASKQQGLENLGASPEDLSSNEGRMEELGLDDVAQQALHAVSVRADQAFDKILLTIQAVSASFHSCMQAIQPDEGTIEFGLSIKADAGVVVTRAGGEASFKVSFTWRSEQH